jgi:hypothetical protein
MALKDKLGFLEIATTDKVAFTEIVAIFLGVQQVSIAFRQQ